MAGKFIFTYLLIVLLSMAGTAARAAASIALTVNDTLFSDSSGRRIVVHTPFRRIISLYGAHTENLYAMGAGDQVIGVGSNDEWPPEVRSKPVHSYHDDLEKFLAVQPDLILLRPMIDRGYGQLIRQLEDHGVRVVSLQPSSLDQMFVYWQILGLLTGRQEAARGMTAHFKETMNRTRRLTAAIPEKKRVYFEAIHDCMRTFAPTAMPVMVLETAGGINVASDAVPRRGTNIADYGKERILSHAGEIDVYLAQIGPMNRPTPAIIQSEPGFNLIRAVRNKEIYLIDEKLVSRPTLRMLEGICRIGRILYPHIFTDDGEATGCAPVHGSLTPASTEKDILP
jgi:iron complex transport system substrate-binding protein